MRKTLSWIIYFIACTKITFGLTEGECKADVVVVPTLPHVVGHVEAQESSETCKERCALEKFVVSGIENGNICYCGEADLTATMTDGLATCIIKCTDATTDCGGIDKLNLFEVVSTSVTITMAFTDDINAIVTGTAVTATIVASEGNFVVDWGDGSTPTVGLDTHTYELPGSYIVKASHEEFTDINKAATIKVHDTPLVNFTCPELVEVGVADECKVTSQRQGFDFQVDWTLTDYTTSETTILVMPAEILNVYGSTLAAGDGSQASAGLTTDNLAIITEEAIRSGGYLVAVRITAEAGTGKVAIYALTPICSVSGNVFCGNIGKCAATCSTKISAFTCSNNLCPTKSTCNAVSCGNVPSSTYEYTLIDEVTLDATDYKHDFYSPKWIPAGSLIAVGGDADLSVRAPFSDAFSSEPGDTIFTISTATISSSSNKYLTQVTLRDDNHLDVDVDFTCIKVAPIPNAEVPPPHTIATAAKVEETKLTFTYKVSSTIKAEDDTEAVPILCQQKILDPVLDAEIWIEHGVLYNHKVTFSQGSPLFSEVDIDGTAYYEYKDDGTAGYEMTLELEYIAAGVYVMEGQTHNLLTTVNYETIVHSIPPVTDNWALAFTCPCLDMDVGFPFELTLPTQLTPPWNASFQATFELGKMFPDEFLDFGTEPDNGAADNIDVMKTAVVLTKGVYNVEVVLTNRISTTTVTQTVEVVEGIRDVTADMTWDNSGLIMDGLGPDKTMFLANFTTFIRPKSRTGTPDKWKITYVESGNEIETTDATEFFSEIYPYVTELTVIISGYNSVQGWVDSPPYTIRVVYKIQGIFLNDKEQITQPYETRTIVTSFIIWIPLACTRIDYGDDTIQETYGFQTLCESKYPDRAYMGEAQVAPIDMTHVYTKIGIYAVTVVAFDGEVELMGEVSVPVGDFPCTMPTVEISDSIKMLDSAQKVFRANSDQTVAIVDYKCNGTYQILKWWEINQLDSNGFVIKDIYYDKLVLTTWDSATFTLPAKFLDYGIYKLTFTFGLDVTEQVKIEGEEFTILKRNDYTFIEVLASPLVPRITLGSASKIKTGYGQLLALDGGDLSYDPDDDEPRDLNINWWCRQVAPITSETLLKDSVSQRYVVQNSHFIPEIKVALLAGKTTGCFGEGPGYMNTTRNINFNTASYTNNEATYEFRMEASKGERFISTSLVVEVVSIPPPNLLVNCSIYTCHPSKDYLVINPTERLALPCTCTDYCGDDETQMKFSWSINSIYGEILDMSSDDCLAATTGEAVSISSSPPACTPTFLGMEESGLAINRKFFDQNSDVEYFYLQCKGITDGDVEGFSEITLKTNKPPVGGSCVLQTTAARALLDPYPCVCSNWRDPEEMGELTYSIYYLKGDPPIRVPVATTTRSELDLFLPYEELKPLYVDVIDKLGASTTTSLGEVDADMPTEKQFFDYGPEAVIDYLNKTNDQLTLSMVLAALNSIKANADWLSLTSEALEGLTDDEILDRIAYIAKLNEFELETAISSLDLTTLDGLISASSILKSTTGIILNPNASKFASLALSYNGKLSAFELLKLITEAAKTVKVSDPHDLVPVLANAMDATDALLKTINSVFKNATGGLYSSADLDNADDMDYDTSVPDKNDAVISTDPHKQRSENLGDSTKESAPEQIDNMMNMLDNLYRTVYDKCVVGDIVRSVSEHGSAMIVAKLGERLLIPGMTITLDGDIIAIIVLPKKFCPSRHINPNTNCNEIFGLKILRFKSIVFIYPTSSAFLAEDTEVIEVAVDVLDQRVQVVDENPPILIDIPRTSDKMPDSYLVEIAKVPLGKVPIIHHLLTIKSFDSAITIDIKTVKTVPNTMVLMLDFEHLPVWTKFLEILYVKNMQRNPSGSYSYFIDSKKNNNKTGRFFIGIAELNSGVRISSTTTKLKKTDFKTTPLSTDYTIRVSTSGCYAFDDDEREWTSKNMWVVKASPSKIACATEHMTAFGAGFSVLPNTIDFQYIFSSHGFLDNASIYVVLILVTSVLFILLLWSHYMDRKDEKYRGVLPLPDNVSTDKYLYEITIKTGPDSEASTDSNINFIASGDYGETDSRFLPKANNYLYRRFAVNKFVMAVPKPLGHINFLRLFHDNFGEPPLDSWQVESVVFRDLQTNEKSIFAVNAWLAFDRDIGKVDKTFMCLEGNEAFKFGQELYTKGNSSMNQDHMWMSIFTRPFQSRFSRKERTGVCMCYLFLSLLINAIWYENSMDSPQDSKLNLGLLVISIKLFLIGIIVIFAVYPIAYILSFVFKRARPKNLKRCRSLDAIEKQRRSELTGVDIESKWKVEIDDRKRPRQKEKSPIKCIPWWTRYLAWFFIIAACGGSAFIVWAYGIMWGEIKTVKFLSSFIISFLISIVITQWIKVLLCSLCAVCCQRIDTSLEDTDCDEELPALKQNEEWFHMRFMDIGERKKVHKVEGVDVTNPEVEKLRDRMIKERQMNIVIKGIIVYCVFLAIIYTLIDARTDYNAFLLKAHMENTLIKKGHLELDYSDKIKTAGNWWFWAKNVILQELRAQRHYNLRKSPPYGLKGFMDDKANRMIGYPIIRQIRTPRFNCKPVDPMDQMIDHCSGIRGLTNEETGDFCANWLFNETEGLDRSCKYPEFKYQTAEELKTYYSTGTLGFYSGGGYVIRLTGNQDKLLERMTQLQKTKWIDKNTRAVILEFSVYNANVNLFAICTVMAEFLDGGGIIPKWRFEPLRLIKDEGIQYYVSTVAEILFAISIAFFTVREMWEMNKQKLSYFTSYWNLAECCILVTSYIIIGLYFYKTALTQEALDIFNYTHGNGYVRMDSAAYIDQIYILLLSLVVFFSTIKLIKLLQFNKRMNVLALTIGTCWDELKVFLVAFAIVFFAFSCLFFFMFQTQLEEFGAIISALQTSFSMMLGRFDFEAMNRANNLSPLLFFVFSVMNSMILINIMLTIILQAFNLVKKDLEKQENKLNVVDFVWNQFKIFARIENRKFLHVNPKYTDKKDHLPQQDTAGKQEGDVLPDKVSQLVKYINDVYFEGRLDVNDPQTKKSLFNAPRTSNNEGTSEKRKVIGSDD